MSEPIPALRRDGIQLLVDESNEVFVVIDGTSYLVNRQKARLERYGGNPATDPWHAPLREPVFEDTHQVLRYTRS